MKYLFLPLTILSILLMKSYSKDSFYYENENNISIDKLAHITEILTPVRTSDNKIYEDVNKPTIVQSKPTSKQIIPKDSSSDISTNLTTSGAPPLTDDDTFLDKITNLLAPKTNVASSSDSEEDDPDDPFAL
jgi:hypothetical protein